MRITILIVYLYCICSINWAAIGLAEDGMINIEKDTPFDMNEKYNFSEQYLSIENNYTLLFNRPEKPHQYFAANFALQEDYPLNNHFLLTGYIEQKNASEKSVDFQQEVRILGEFLSNPACLSADENEFLAHYNQYKDIYINNQETFTQLADTLMKKRSGNFIEFFYTAKKAIRLTYEKNTDGYMEIGNVFRIVEEKRLVPYPRMSIRYERAKSQEGKPDGYYMAIHLIDGYTRGTYYKVGIEYSTNNFLPQGIDELIKRKEIEPNWYYFERSGTLDG